MYEGMYKRAKEKLINDNSVNPENRAIIVEFLTWQEYKLKRKEGLSEVDERSYKTLYFYIGRIKNINKWFNNKSWRELTKEEIKKVIDDLEDGKIVNQYGKRYCDREQFYQMFQNKFFALAGKNHFARDIIEEFQIKGRRNTRQVRFVDEEGFLKIVDNTTSVEQKAILWTCWDIGENISTILSLERSELKRQTNPDTGEPEYLVILPKEKLKRSRTPRSELTNYPQTVKYLDLVLENLKPTEKVASNKFVKNKKLSDLYKPEQIFKMSWKSVEKFFRKAVERSGVRCLPGGERPTIKDLRSGMACRLLKGNGEEGSAWSIEEISARLGHSPSSRFVIDKYVTYLALDRKKAKKKIYEGSLIKVETELSKQKEFNKLQSMRMESLQKENEEMQTTITQTANEMKEILIQFENFKKQSIKS